MNLLEIPKVELHCHLELCFRHETLIEVGKVLGQEVPADPSVFRKKWLITEPMQSLAEVLDRFRLIQAFWSSEELIQRLTFEACEDALQQGIKIMEFRYSPTYIQNGRSMSFEKIHNAILKGLKQAEHLPLATGLIGILQRTLPLQEAEEVAEFVIDQRDSFIAMDLADNEVGFDCLPFAPFFQKAKDKGLRITVHSGEENVPEGPQFVRNAIEELGAERIGHGLQIIQDPDTVAYVRDKKIPLELCPTSNWITNAISKIDEHPIRQLMEADVLVTINSDDPGMFGIELLDEYKLLRDTFQFSEEEFRHCNDVAAKASFISKEKKQAVWPRPL